MRFLFTILFALAAFTSTSFAQAPDWLWVKSHSAYTAGHVAVATGESGNVYAMGIFVDSLLLDNILLTNPNKKDNTDYKTYIVKYDIEGRVIWAKRVGANKYSAGSLALDKNENIYMAGVYGSQDSVENIPLNGSGCYIAKYTFDGSLEEVKTLSGIPNSIGSVTIASDPFGDVYLASQFYGTVALDTITLTSNGNADVLLASYDSGLTLKWATSIGGKNKESIKDLVADKFGNVYIAGGYSDVITYGSFVFSAKHVAGCSNCDNTFLFRFDSTGNATKGSSYPILSNDYYQSLRLNTDENGNLLMVGKLADILSIGNIVLQSAGFQKEGFAAKLDTAGNALWAKKIASSGSFEYSAACCDRYGSLYVAGEFEDSINFDGNKLAGSQHVSNRFVAKVNNIGNVSWAKQIEGGGVYFQSSDLNVDPLGNLYVCGHFDDTCNFDQYAIIEEGDINPFLAKLASSTFVNDILKAEENILIYPNPTTGNLTINVDNDGYDNVAVYDAIGRRIHQQPVSKQQKTTKLELGHLANGVYNLRLSGKDKQLNRQVSVLK